MPDPTFTELAKMLRPDLSDEIIAQQAEQFATMKEMVHTMERRFPFEEEQDRQDFNMCLLHFLWLGEGLMDKKQLMISLYAAVNGKPELRILSNA